MALGASLTDASYGKLQVFIDPIDGTREFCTGKGEQSTICVGFALDGRAVAGAVYRPLTSPPTWAIGAPIEEFHEELLATDPSLDVAGFITTNGYISPFLTALMEGLGVERVMSGGVGNKVMMLLEKKARYYIQDRGVSRWDTCAAEAVLLAHGGTLCKLAPFVADGTVAPYTYIQGPTNLDFVPNIAELTKYNARDPKAAGGAEGKKMATDVEQVQPYSNLCGFLAVRANEAKALPAVREALLKAVAVSPPEYN
mmetsp:Transcript_49674/g.107923  ORF Transcript_49674/g.107923 Transcript_49674/m.107923 type:complete len:255 (+) Transcript_49674:357-1121(+)